MPVTTTIARTVLMEPTRCTDSVRRRQTFFTRNTFVVKQAIFLKKKPTIDNACDHSQQNWPAPRCRRTAQNGVDEQQKNIALASFDVARRRIAEQRRTIA